MAIMVTGRKHLALHMLPRPPFGNLKRLSWDKREWSRRRYFLLGTHEADS